MCVMHHNLINGDIDLGKKKKKTFCFIFFLNDGPCFKGVFRFVIVAQALSASISGLCVCIHLTDEIKPFCIFVHKLELAF